nr:hypothetical protein [Paracoccus aminovorans]
MRRLPATGRFLDHALRDNDVFPRGQMREQVELPENHTDLLSQCLQTQIVLRHMCASDADRALVDAFKPVDAAQ